MSDNASNGLKQMGEVFGPLHENLVGDSGFVHELKTTIERLAATELTVLITGETGTGKDIVARLLHRTSARNGQPFVKVHCPALPNDLLESELFGYEKGAFTGAHTAKPGRFELANTGTIFLDEISEISESSQIKLMQILDHEPFMRIGGIEPVSTDARVIAATNIPIEDAVRKGSLRNDVCFRLSEFVIHMLPLRERAEDIPLLAEHFNFNFSKKCGKAYEPLPSDLVEYMQRLPWPGNVRELAARVREYAATGDDSAIRKSNDDRPALDIDDTAFDETQPEPKFTPLKKAVQQAVQETERALIEEALRYTLWNRRKAAKLLQTSYSSLLRRIETYEIGKP